MIHGYPWPMWVCIIGAPTLGGVALVWAILADRRARRRHRDPDAEPTQQEINRAAYRWGG